MRNELGDEVSDPSMKEGHRPQAHVLMRGLLVADVPVVHFYADTYLSTEVHQYLDVYVWLRPPPSCKANPQRANFINQQANMKLMVTKQNPGAPQVPTPHRTTGAGSGETRYPFMLAAIDRLTTCKPNPREGQLINQQAKIRFDCHRTKNHKGQRHSGGGGKQKEDAVKLVVCMGGGDYLQAINQQAKICVSPNRMLENHKCQHHPAPHCTTGKVYNSRRASGRLVFSPLYVLLEY